MNRLLRHIVLVAAVTVASGTAAEAQNSTATPKQVATGQAATQQQSIQQYIDNQITNGPLSGAVVGVCAIDFRGSGSEGKNCGSGTSQVVAAYNAQTRMVPASNMKLVTTGAALHAFGPEYRFKTRIGYSGSIAEDGTLHGNVYIIGGGDPTIGAADSTAYKADALFWKWKVLLQQAGIKRIDGNIIGDGSSYEGGLEHPAWDYADTWTYYGAGTSALSFYENVIDLEVSAGSKAGEKVNMRQAYPETPWLTVENQATTGPAETGNSLYLQTSSMSNKAVLTGTYAIDRKPKREQAANKYGALTCAHEFYKNLKATGWEVTGTYGEEMPDHIGHDGRTVIGETLSPALAQICRKTNYDSDNFYAEALLRAMGEAASGIAVYDSCLVAINEVLEDIMSGQGKVSGTCDGNSDKNMMFNWQSGIIQKDGSGLARSNSISPEWMVGYLAAMKDNQAFIASIPHPGEGTLYNLKNLQPYKFRIKSGSMGGTLCYSGYVLDDDGKPITAFAIFTNNLNSKLSQVRPVLEGLIQIITKN